MGYDRLEIKSILSLLGCPAVLKENDLKDGSPFMEVQLSSETAAKALMQRTVLSKRLYELWGEGSNLLEVKEQIKQLPKDSVEPYTNECSSFRIVVETFNKKLSTSDKIKRIEQLTEPGSVFCGQINLSQPDNSFHLLEFYHFEGTSQPANKPSKVYFGRWVSDGQRDRIRQYHLQNRHFIANTSMDACLSMVMANLAQVKDNDFVLDPFVGSGSLLVASAHYGAYVAGTDIDYLLLHARAKPSRAKQKARSRDESVRSNLKQYGFESKYIDVLVADASRHKMWREGCHFDAIVTDPPYGIRESAAKIVNVKDSEVKSTDECAQRYPQKAQYQLGDIFKDLLNFAAKFLRRGGRLVYWLPIYKPDYHESNIPQHPCLEVESNCEQPLSTTISRRLITMVKTEDYTNNGEQEEPQASIPVDHYECETFRQKYFRAVESEASATKGGGSTREESVDS
ncbi:tRNA (guanine(10)-n2)-methyltransferase homolog [Plakobranchus ocellatus]|uniref:tRNA (guanine(10)-N(2))-methyltransferase TRMT11 n=1 Tax=Plakobranchus ocellatus TaxID=259542 RepID=A0AAV4BZ36_9GAST|nr:tRNA (guanine(10)-n2)-methyltransferase homolog [Plakobranchus ocellatus]